MKKILCLLLSVLMAAGALSLSAFAAGDAVAYISFVGADTNDGKTADTPKKTLGKLSGNGAVSLLKHGGTLVASQKLYFGADYVWEVPGAVTITANYGGKDYKNPEPEKNPASGMMKFKSGATLTIKSDVTIDDIILFQEANQNTIIVEDGGSLTITDKVVCMSAKSYYMNIEVMDGGKAEIGGGIFSAIEGDGDIKIADGVKVLGSSTVEEPTGPAEVKDGLAFINYQNGNDANDGTSAAAPKKAFGKPTGSGVLSLLTRGGTLVVTGKAYIGSAKFELPEMSGELVITSNYGGVDYKKATPETNPDCAFKIQSGGELTINSDVRFDDIILFQEGAQNTIVVKPSTTLIITDKVVLMSKPGVEHHFRIVIESGATAILSEEAQSTMTIENSGELLTYQSAEPVTPTEPESKFTASRTYADAFTDVPAKAWFYTYVKTAYEYALANGTGKTSFSPDTTFTAAQALTAAANIHKAYTGKTIDTAGAANWYDPYVSYCVANGIITADQFAADKMNQPISRGDMAIVFANILPESEYTVVREKALTDVEDGAAYAAAVRKLANAGIVGGDAGTGKFRPADDIKRSEACVIFTRIAVASMRDTKKD